MEVNCNGVIYNVSREPYESSDVLSARAWYIAKKCPMTLESFLHYQRLSLFWANIRFLGCRYPPKIMDLLQDDLD